MEAILVVMLVLLILITLGMTLGLGYMFYRVYNIEDFIGKKISGTNQALKGHKTRAIKEATAAAKNDWENIIFDVPELKTIFPDLANVTLQKGNVNPGLFGAGLLNSLGDLAPLIGMAQGGEVDVATLAKMAIEHGPKLIGALLARRNKKIATTDVEEQKVDISKAKLTY